MDPDDHHSTLARSVASSQSSLADTRLAWAEPISILAVVCYQLFAVVFGVDVLDVSVLRTVAGVVLLTILPGYLLVSLLGVDDRSVGLVVLYSVGLSVPVVAALGLVVNFSLRPFTVPLSPRTLTAAVSVFVVGLTAVRHARFGLSRSPLAGLSIPAGDRSFFVLFGLLPVYSVVGAIYTNAFDYDYAVIALTVALSLVPLLLLCWRGSPTLYPFAIWSVAASVLLGMTLVSGHIWGWDIHYEYRTATIIFESGYWDPSRPSATNSLLSITLLASVYSMVTGQELVWIYKVVYPLVVSLLPVGIWYLARRQFADRSVAVLAPFVLVFYYGFFKTMPDKQIVAELFAVLVLVALLDDETPSASRWVLAVVFAVGMVFSHYATSLLFLGFLLFVFVGRYVLRAVPFVEAPTARLTRPAFVGFIGVFWLVWYRFTASGVNLYRIIDLGDRLIVQLLSGAPVGRSGADYATMTFESELWIAYRLLHVVLIGLIAVGVLRAIYSLYTGRGTPRSGEFALLSAGVFGFLTSSVLVTFAMGFDRTLLVALFALSPFAAFGLTGLHSVGSWLIGWRSPALRAHIDAIPLKSLFAVFLAVFFVVSSGTAFALAGEEVPPYSINLNQSSGWPVYGDSEVAATRWVTTHDGPGEPGVAVYNTKQSINSRDGLLLREVLDTEHIEPIWLSKRTVENATYVYVSDRPVKEPDGGTEFEYIDPHGTPFYRETLSTADKVYSSPNASIYHVP